MLNRLVFLMVACCAVHAYAAEFEPLYKLRGKGFVAAIDCREGGVPADYAEGVQKIERLFGIAVSNRQGRAFTLANASDQLKESRGSVAVFIIDDKSMPLALAASEERWAMLNAAKVKADAPDAKKLARRLSLLFTRQCCRALGDDEVKGQETAFHAVLGVKDLDAITSFDITMGPELSVNEVMGLRGIEVEEYGTYEDACEMGIALPPTNDHQRAIWQKVNNKKIDAKDPTARWKRDFPDKEKPNAK